MTKVQQNKVSAIRPPQRGEMDVVQESTPFDVVVWSSFCKLLVLACLLLGLGVVVAPCSPTPGQGTPDGLVSDGSNERNENTSDTSSAEISDVTQEKISLVVQETEQPMLLVVDATHMYWLTTGQQAMLRKAPKTGGTIETLAQQLFYPGQLALYENQLYWTVHGSLWRISIQGGSPEEVIKSSSIQAFVVDKDKIYWTSTDEVSSVPKTGGSSTPLFKGEFTTGLTVDHTHVYWVNRLAGEIHRGEKDGKNSNRLVFFVGDQTMQLWHDETYLYWLTPNDRNFSRIAKSGGKREVIANNVSMLTVVWNADWIYWTNHLGDGAIVRMKPGQKPETLLSQLGMPWGIAVDEKYIYWSEHNKKQILRTPIP